MLYNIKKLIYNKYMKNCTFVKSVFSNNEYILDNKSNIVFIGRSNVGKSSLINAIFNNKTLSRTSSKQGLTKSINYFDVDNKFYFVDLPGYGYSKANKTNENMWENLIEGYLLNPSKKLIIMLVDIRIKPTEQDKQMLSFLNFYHINYLIVATKCDKISKSQQNNLKLQIARELNVGQDNVMFCSSVDKTNINLLKEKIEKWVSDNDETLS